MSSRLPRVQAIVLATLVMACSSSDRSGLDRGTREDRAGLFDYVFTKTLERESFSPVKAARLGLDIERAMHAYRAELIAADSDDELFYALAKISNARRDRHLRIGLVAGGLRLADSVGVGQSNYPTPGSVIPHAPVRFAVDYGTPGAYFVFVADVASNVGALAVAGGVPEYGDRLLAVNGLPFADYVDRVRPYHRYSTTAGFWWQLATWLPQRSRQFPVTVYERQLSLDLERATGEQYAVHLPYVSPDSIVWSGHGDRNYPGFQEEFRTEAYTLYLPENERPALLLQWNGFRENLKADVDRLMQYAVENELLDHAVIVDATRSRGGSNGPYALRRLSSRPFRTTFGNLRVSDASIAWARDRTNRLRDRPLGPAVLGDGDDGGWLLAWLQEDFAGAVERGDEYTPAVPFKLAHLPKESDGIVQPADTHFRGPLVVWLSPYGGSHLDQFASIVVDNALGHTIGMPAAGYSNTWEWEETLVFKRTGQPVVSFMWSIGHTLRPNGEILEGNPADVHDVVPVTRENHATYYPSLLSRTVAHLGLE